jgi:hypothetical protein
LYTWAEAVHQLVRLVRLPIFDLAPLIVLEAARSVRDGQVLEGVRIVNPFAESFHLEVWI